MMKNVHSVEKINKRIIAWGADKTFEHSTKKHPIKIDYFLDNDNKKWDTTFYGRSIKSPSILKNENIDEVTIIIFTFFFPEIREQLEELGLVYKKNFFHFLDFIEYRDLIDTIVKEKDYLFLKKIIKPGYYCIDIGANCGFFTYKLSKLVGKKGKVYSIEPLKQAYEQLLRFKEIYSLINVIPFNTALIDRDKKKIKMIVPRINNRSRTGLAHLYLDGNIKRERERKTSDPDEFKRLYGNNRQQDLTRGDIQEVNSHTLDNVINEIKPKKIDYIKCDVEGSELFVLRGGSKTIDLYNPLIQCELAWNYYENNIYKGVVDFLKTKGYNHYYVVNNHFIKLGDYKRIKREHNYYFIHETQHDNYKKLMNVEI